MIIIIIKKKKKYKKLIKKLNIILKKITGVDLIEGRETEYQLFGTLKSNECFLAYNSKKALLFPSSLQIAN